MDDEDFVTAGDEENSEIDEKIRRKSSKRKNVPTLESQRDIFNKETLEQIKIFREARRQWLEEKEQRKGEIEYDDELLFGDDQIRRKQTWFKRTRIFNFCRNLRSKESLRKKYAVSKKPVDKSLEEGIQLQNEEEPIKPVKSILKIVTKKDIEERELREQEREASAEFDETKEPYKESITFVDEKEKRMREFDEVNKDLKKRKVLPKKIPSIPVPEQECRCDRSGEYTVSVKGVCFCGRSNPPTCIPIIPPEYIKPHSTESVKSDVKIERRDSLMYHKISLEQIQDSLPDDVEEIREIKPPSQLHLPSQEILHEEHHASRAISHEILPPKELSEGEPSKSKSVEDLRIEKLMPHHKTHFREDHYHPIHFQELTEDKSETGLKDSTSDLDEDIAKKHPFLLKRKGSRIPIRTRDDLFEKSSTVLRHEKERKNKPEHGHVHFDQDTLSNQDSDHEVKYKKSSETIKRKQNRTTMTVLIDFFYDWWKRKPK